MALDGGGWKLFPDAALGPALPAPLPSRVPPGRGLVFWVC